MNDLIQNCKNEIIRRATDMGLSFDKDDIVSCLSGEHIIVFLRRCDPIQSLDENGQPILRDGKPVFSYTYPVYLVHPPSNSTSFDWNTQHSQLTVTMLVPKVVVRIPELVFIILSNGHVKYARFAPDFKHPALVD